MNYLSIEQIKKQCNIDPEWDGDNEYLEMVGDAAEDMTQALLDCDLALVEAEYGGMPPTVLHAMRMLVDYFYSQQRGSTGESIEIPDAVITMLKLYRNFK